MGLQQIGNHNATTAAKIDAYLTEKDPILAKAIAVVELPVIDAHNDIYKELLDAIVSQQLSVKAAATIYNRFLDLFPNRNPAPEWILQCSDEQLRGVGLSFQKLGYMRNVARYWQENNALDTDWLSKTDAEIISELTTIKGVGKWTVQMILMFKLNRPDVFPPDDLGIQQGMKRLYNLPDDLKGKALIARMNEISEQWQPYRTIGSRYIWRWKDQI